MNGSRVAKGVLLAAIQLALVGSLAAKLMYDRATRPRGWALAQTYDPSLPIRGRYLALQMHVPADDFRLSDHARNTLRPNAEFSERWAYYSVRDGHIAVSPFGALDQSGGWIEITPAANNGVNGVSRDPLELFIPDSATVPTLKPGEEMWIEVTLPKSGPPRPIRLALKQKDGSFTPLDLH